MCLTGICDYPYQTNIRKFTASDTGGPKFSPAATLWA